MADHRDILGEWREAARRKARELDEKYKIKDRVEEGTRAAQDAAKRGASRVMSEAERARAEAEKLGEEFEVGGHVKDAREQARAAAEEAAKAAREAGDRLREAGRAASQRAGETFGEAKTYYERAARVAGAGARAGRAATAVSAGFYRAYDWARRNPKQAVLVSFSLAAGVPLGASFPAFDAVLLGAHPHWLTHSALPVWAARRASTKLDRMLREREDLLARGELDEAERRRVEFERTMVRYVGAPLLGAFSCAAGAAICAQIFRPGHIVGAPVSWLLGGNPILEGVWLFTNGVI
ncbi:MAG: hypothetical protein ACRD9R_24390, partial [Pyrinomonadaceae bacterium]